MSSNAFPPGCLCCFVINQTVCHILLVLLLNHERLPVERHESNIMIVTNTGTMFSSLWHHAADARGFKGHVSTRASDGGLRLNQARHFDSSVTGGERINMSTQIDLFFFSCAIDLNYGTSVSRERESEKKHYGSLIYFCKCYLNKTEILTYIYTLKPRHV